MLKLLTAIAQVSTVLLQRYRREKYEREIRKIEQDPVRAWNELSAKRVHGHAPKAGELPTGPTDATPRDQ